MSEMLLRILRTHANTFVCNNTHTHTHGSNHYKFLQNSKVCGRRYRKFRSVCTVKQFGAFGSLSGIAITKLCALDIIKCVYRTYSMCTAHKMCTGHKICVLDINDVYWTSYHMCTGHKMCILVIKCVLHTIKYVYWT